MDEFCHIISGCFAATSNRPTWLARIQTQHQTQKSFCFFFFRKRRLFLTIRLARFQPTREIPSLKRQKSACFLKKKRLFFF
jgi:hypothetical protein